LIGLDDKIFYEKKEYINIIKQRQVGIENIIIYGAGKIGKVLLNLCKFNGIEISAFGVTDQSINHAKIENVPVIQIEDMPFDKEKTLILLGFKGSFSIVPDLLQKGWKNYIEMPQNALLFDRCMQEKVKRPTLEITPKIGCGINCKYCPQNILIHRYFEDNKNRTSVMTFDTFKKCIDKTPQDLIVEFAGFVEPFLNRESLSMMEYVQSTGRDMTLFTTLVGLTEDDFWRLKGLHFEEIVLHTPDEDGYANIPMTDEYFKLLDLMLDAKDRNGKAFISSANCQSKPHARVLEHTHGRLKIYVELSDRAGNIQPDDIIVSKNVEGRISCSRTLNLNHNILLPDGTVVLCCMDFGMKHVIGNLLEESYDTIMKSNELRCVKRAMNFKFEDDILCRQCSHATTVI
jgi:hypothetical protein